MFLSRPSYSDNSIIDKPIFRLAHVNILENNDPREQSLKHPNRCCPECHNTDHFVNDPVSGDIVCPECGVVVEERTIDQNKEWREYTNDDIKARSRVGPQHNIFMYDGGLSTIIGSIPRDYRGSHLSSFGLALQNRLKRAQERYNNVGNKDKNFSDAMTILLFASQALDLNDDVKREVAIRYKKIVKSQVLKGRPIQYIILSLIYIVRAEMEHPITVSEICDKCNISETDFTSYRKKVYKALNITPFPVTPRHYLLTVHNVLQPNNGTVLEFSRFLYDYVISMNPSIFQGKDPAGIAAGLYYLACSIMKCDCTQHQIREVLYVTDVTVRTRYREIIKAIFQSKYNPINHLKMILSKSKLKKEEIKKLISDLLKIRKERLQSISSSSSTT